MGGLVSKVESSNYVIQNDNPLLSIHHLPEELLLQIFLLLNEQELKTCRLICKEWLRIAKDRKLLKPLDPAEFAFGKKKWEIYYGACDNEPLLPEDICETLYQPCPFSKNPKLRVKDTHKLILMVKTINDQKQHLNHLDTLFQNPRQGHKSQFGYYDDICRAHVGNKSIKNPYWMLIKKEIIEESRNKSYVEQKKLIKSYPGYSVATALEVCASVVTEYVVTGKQLFGRAPLTYTVCKDTVMRGATHVIIGGFNSNGLVISLCDRHSFDQNRGITPVRRLNRQK